MGVPNDGGECFEVEIGAIDRTQRDDPGWWAPAGGGAPRPPAAPSPTSPPLAREALTRVSLSRGARARRLATILGVVALALVILVPEVRVLVPGLGFVAAPPARIGARAGDVWSALEQRPLRLALLPDGAGCPASVGRDVAAGTGTGLGGGPVYAVAPGADRGELLLRTDLGSRSPNAFGKLVGGFDGQLVRWVVAPGYQGPVLVRGRQLDGFNQVRFMGGLGASQGASDLQNTTPAAELRLLGTAGYGAPWPVWVTYTQVAAPAYPAPPDDGAGCYAYQVDGLTFSEVIVFRAIPAASLA